MYLIEPPVIILFEIVTGTCKWFENLITSCISLETYCKDVTFLSQSLKSEKVSFLNILFDSTDDIRLYLSFLWKQPGDPWKRSSVGSREVDCS